jgi:hypothetical protein
MSQGSSHDSAGIDGATILNGSGAPSAGLGRDNDYYIDNTADGIYGPKTGGAWGSITSLYGATVLSGSGAPGAVGRDNDFYIDLSVGALYGPKAGGAWPGGSLSLVGNVGATGPASTPGVQPTAYVEMTTPRTTTSGTLEDITGATTTITLTATCHVSAYLVCNVVSTGVSDIGCAISFDGTDHDEQRVTMGSGDDLGCTVVHRTTTTLGPGTYTVKGRFRRISGAGTPGVNRADLLVVAHQGAVAAKPWYGKIIGAMGGGDPNDLWARTKLGVVNTTPTNLGTTRARVAIITPEVDHTFNRIRYFGIGAVTGLYRMQIYNLVTGAPLLTGGSGGSGAIVFTTASNVWRAVTDTGPGGVGGTGVGATLNLTLSAGVPYGVAFSTHTTGTTAGILCVDSSLSSTSGQMLNPFGAPGNLDPAHGFMNVGYAELAVSTGVLPATCAWANLLAPGSWTGGFPAVWLDNSDDAT